MKTAIRTPRQSISLVVGAVAVVLAGLLMPSAAMAEAWRVDVLAGAAWIRTEGAQPIALTTRKKLDVGAVIETGDTGRVVLTRGEESIVVAPNTSIGLPETSSRGMATTILQKVGTILLSVEKKATQHFEVETPYLAAVVKGTKFTVSVDREGAAVHVVEGAVEVIDLDTGEVGMVRPGHTAVSLAGSGLGLSLSGPGADQPKPGPARESRRVPVPSATDVGTAASTASARGQGVALTASLGQRVLDVAKATGGLARGKSAATAANQGSNGVAGSAGGAPGLNVASEASGTRNSSGAAPGVSASAPGISGTAPGLSGAAPGVSASAPGISDAAPGLSGAAPGLSVAAVSQSNGGGNGVGAGGTPPGQGRVPPGQAKKK